MSHAIEEARLARDESEVPVGAIVCELAALSEGRVDVVSRAHNRVEQLRDATAHAEVLAIQEASRKLGAWRLVDKAIVCTLEPCVMCLGAIRLSRIPLVIFGAGDSRFGALGSVYKLDSPDRTGPAPTVFRGVSGEECANLLKDFFALRRQQGELGDR